MMPPVLSIIMPIYNHEKYLQTAIESIQKLSNIEYEIICIDDASTDNSLKILKELQEKNCRIKIIKNSENIGAGLSRNKGIELATGDLIFFMDSDDWVIPEALENVCKKAIENNLDIIHYSMNLYLEKENIYKKYCVVDSKFLNKIFNVNDNFDFLLDNFDISTGSNIYKKDFLIKNNIRFPDLIRIEDIFFVEKAIALSKRLMIVPDIVLIYRQHSGSAKYNNYYHDFLFKNYFLFVEFLNNYENKKLKEYFLLKELNGLFIDFIHVLKKHPEYRYRFFKDVKNFMNKIDLSFISSDKISTYTFYSTYQKFKKMTVLRCMIFYFLYDNYIYITNFLDKYFKISSRKWIREKLRKTFIKKLPV